MTPHDWSVALVGFLVGFTAGSVTLALSVWQAFRSVRHTGWDRAL